MVPPQDRNCLGHDSSAFMRNPEITSPYESRPSTVTDAAILGPRVPDGNKTTIP